MARQRVEDGRQRVAAQRQVALRGRGPEVGVVDAVRDVDEADALDRRRLAGARRSVGPARGLEQRQRQRRAEAAQDGAAGERRGHGWAFGALAGASAICGADRRWPKGKLSAVSMTMMSKRWPPARGLGDDVVDHRVVGVLQGAAQGVGQHPLGEHAREVVDVRDDQLLELRRAVELQLAGQLAGDVDRLVADLVAPARVAVEVLQAEADRIHHAVAAGAGRALAVDLQHLAVGGVRVVLARELQLRDVRRRRRRWLVEDLLDDPAPAPGRAGAVGVGVGDQQRAEGQDAAAPPIAERHQAHLVAGHAGDAVERRQRLVEVGVPRVDEVGDRAPLAQDVAEQPGGLGDHRLPHRSGELVVVAVPVAAPRGLDQVAQQQPLAGEVVDEALRARITDHAHYLCPPYGRLLQGARGREVEQGRIGWARPQEVGHPAGQVVVVEAAVAVAVGDPLALDAEQEFRADQHRLQHLLDRAREAAPLPVGEVEDGQQQVELRGRRGPAERAAGEALGDARRRGTLGQPRPRLGDEHAAAPLSSHRSGAAPRRSRSPPRGPPDRPRRTRRWPPPGGARRRSTARYR